MLQKVQQALRHLRVHPFSRFFIFKILIPHLQDVRERSRALFFANTKRRFFHFISFHHLYRMQQHKGSFQQSGSRLSVLETLVRFEGRVESRFGRLCCCFGLRPATVSKFLALLASRGSGVNMI